MTPRLKLPENFKVPFFGFIYNVNNIGRYLLLVLVGCAPSSVVDSGDLQ